MDSNENKATVQNGKNKITLAINRDGYGPNGLLRRDEWRQLCLQMLRQGKERFLQWQNSWSEEINTELKDIDFDTTKGFEKFGNTNSKRKFNPYTLDYSNCVFEENEDFSGYIFKHITLFTNSIIKNGKFQNCKFHEYVNFYSATFGICAEFVNAEFNEVSFKKTIFRCLYVTFNEAKFNCKVTFDAVQFPEQTTAFSSINFEDAMFLAGLEFRDCSINTLSYFSRARMYHGAKFARVEFKEQCTFTDAIFTDKSIWSDSPSYAGIGADFDEAVFESDVDFVRCMFSVPAYFRKTKFNGDVVFDEAKFFNDFRFFKTEFLGGAFFNETIFYGLGIKRLGQMKRMAEDNGHTDAALNFNALELEHKANAKDAGFWFKLFTNAYRIFSNYGRSFMRPIGAYVLLVFLIAITAMIYSTYSASPPLENQVLCKPNKDQPPPLKLSYERAVFEYAMFRAGGVMDLTDTGKQNNAVNCRLFEETIEPALMRGVGIFKSIASLTLLFLAALGLRNKYRIK